MSAISQPMLSAVVTSLESLYAGVESDSLFHRECGIEETNFTLFQNKETGKVFRRAPPGNLEGYRVIPYIYRRNPASVTIEWQNVNEESIPKYHEQIIRVLEKIFSENVRIKSSSEESFTADLNVNGLKSVRREHFEDAIREVKMTSKDFVRIVGFDNDPVEPVPTTRSQPRNRFLYRSFDAPVSIFLGPSSHYSDSALQIRAQASPPKSLPDIPLTFQDGFPPI